MLSFLSAAVLASSSFAAQAATEAAVIPGVDVLRRGDHDAMSRLRGARVGLITNHTGLTVDGTPTLRVLRAELALDVVALFSPEHGFSGGVAAGDDAPSDASGAIPIHSLYGDTRAPTPEMLSGIDAIVFDIQDIGVRFYTYISTMKLAMDAAAAAGIRFVVLDRPNPNGGVRVAGPVLDPGFGSFVGIAPIPLVHGMTVGELARSLRTDPLELDVVRMEGWRRAMVWDDTGLPFRAPSPNIRTPRATLAYPALGLLEGINVSEGRGIDETFEKIGAPWIDGERLASSLNALGLAGVRFEPTEFVPRATAAAPRPKYRDELCRGVRLVIDMESLDELETTRIGLEVVASVRVLYSEQFDWVETDGHYWIDRLLGTDRPRLAIDRGETVETILDRERPSLIEFMRERSRHLLY